MPMLERQGCQASRVISMALQTKPEMRASRPSSRIDLQELKLQMIKRVGPHKSTQYFECFKGYINSKFSKPHLDKQILLTIGRENIGLHNKIIKAVLKNAVNGEIPPPNPLSRGLSKSMTSNARKPGLVLPTGDVENCAVSSNGSSLRRNHTVGTYVKNISKEKLSNFIFVDNDVENMDVGMLLQKGADRCVEKSETDLNCASIRLGKRPKISSSIDEEVDLESKLLSGNKSETFIESWRNQLIRPPLAAPFNTCTSRKSGLTESLAQLFLTKVVGTQILETDDLPDAEALERHMEYIAMTEGLEGVDAESVMVVNQGLDIFLKKLIRAGINYARPKSISVQEAQPEEGSLSRFSSCTSENHSKRVNDKFRRILNEGETPTPPISFMDFKFAMERNPQQLGEDWPLQLEKILLRTFE